MVFSGYTNAFELQSSIEPLLKYTTPVVQNLSNGPNEEQTNGFVNAIGDYSASVTDFKITAPAKHWILLYRLIPYVKDNGSFDSGSYGNGITLTNGIKIVNGADGRPDFEITGDTPIKVNPDWNRFAGIDTALSEYGAGPETLNARWTFLRDSRFIILDGDLNEFVAIRLEDSFTGLLEHKFGIRGLKLSKNVKV